ncbi:MAG: beta strand repeat-containing protein, partial [Bacteroidales bacterium]
MSGGSLTQSTTTAGSRTVFNFTKVGTQTFTKTGGTITSGTTVGPGLQFNVLPGSILDMGTSVMDGTNQTSFNLSAGAGIITANTAGLSTTAATGSIQVAGTKIYSPLANYTYNSLVATQVTGNGVTGAYNLTFNNTFSTGVTFSNAIAVTGTMAVANSAKVDLGSFTSSAAALTLGGTNQVSPATYGGTGAPGGTTINSTFFDNNSGIVTLALASPSALSYTSPNAFSLSVAITPLFPTVTGVVTTYAISPTLPTGLSFNTTTGYITGTPTVATTAATYTVTATNASGSTTFGVVISVGSYRYAVNAASAAWNLTTTWSTTSGGASGASVPVSGDIVFIGEAATARTVTIPTAYTAVCGSLTMGNVNAATVATLTFTDATSLMNVSGNLVMNRPSAVATSLITLGAGSLTVGGTLELAHNVGLNTGATLIDRITISTGTLTVGNLLYNSDAAAQSAIVFSGAGTLNISGSFTLSGALGTLTPSTGTVNFNGTAVAQTIPIISAVTYNNITVNNTNSGGASLGAATTAANVLGNITVGNLSSGSLLNTGNFAMTFGTTKNLTVALASTLNAGTSVISFGTTGAVAINGTFKTANLVAFSGSATGSIN